jgi:hypothetical protein
VEGRSVIGAANAKEDANGLAHFGLEGMVLFQGAFGPVEDEIFRVFAEELIDAEF